MRNVPTALALILLVCPAAAFAEESDAQDELQAGGAYQVDDRPSETFLHGFRLGYLFVANTDRSADGTPGGESLADKYSIRSQHQFLIGYEFTWRMIGYEWLNVLLVGNFMISGLEQSRFFPSSNGLIGFEFHESFQLGVGIHVIPSGDKPAHMMVAAGWTPQVGTFYTPIHAFFVPDVDGQHRMGATVGVNW